MTLLIFFMDANKVCELTLPITDCTSKAWVNIEFP